MSTDVTYTAAEVAEHRAAWIAALRSGGYAQGYKVLRTLPTSLLYDELEIVDYSEVPEEVRTDLTRSTYCCLGVAECLNGATWVYDAENEDTPFIASDRVTDDSDIFQDQTDVMLTQRTTRWLGLTQPDPSVVIWDDVLLRWTSVALSVLNDQGLSAESGSWSFAQIADVIEAQPADWDGDDSAANARARQLNDEGAQP